MTKFEFYEYRILIYKLILLNFLAVKKLKFCTRVIGAIDFNLQKTTSKPRTKIFILKFSYNRYNDDESKMA